MEPTGEADFFAHPELSRDPTGDGDLWAFKGRFNSEKGWEFAISGWKACTEWSILSVFPPLSVESSAPGWHLPWAGASGE